MRTLMIVRRYRSAVEPNQKGDRRSSDGKVSFFRSQNGSRMSTLNNLGTFIEEGFLQICGPTEGREIQAIQDILRPLKETPYKLQCTCPHCISYSYEVTSSDKTFTEPFMRAINLIFSTISRYGFTLQSTSSVQNADQSNTTTWVWVRTGTDQADHPIEHKKEEEDTRPKRKY